MASDSRTSYDCFAVVAPGLEPVLASEVAGVGIAHAKVEQGGVSFRTGPEGLVAVNAGLRTASRILVRIARFRAVAFHDLEIRARRIPWQVYLRPGSAVRFKVTAHHSRLYHEDAVMQRLLEGVEQRVGRARQPDEGDSGPTQLFVIRLDRDWCTVSADSSGALLHRRGYRLAGAKAPLRETLAAGMLLAIGWNGSLPLLDPFCGAGTIPIEAALIARRMPPGLPRLERGDFAFLDWPGFHRGWAAPVLERLREEVEPRLPVRVMGSDRDPGAVASAVENAARAGVSGVEFRESALSGVSVQGDRGWVVTNPPYGVRVGDQRRIRGLYSRLGELIRGPLAGWNLAMLEARGVHRRYTGLSLHEVLTTRNGGIRVRLVSSDKTGAVDGLRVSPSE